MTIKFFYQQGVSFAHAVSKSLNSKKFDKLITIINENISYVIAVACAGAVCNINKLDLVNAYFHAFISNLISAALRLMSIGQTESQILIIKFNFFNFQSKFVFCRSHKGRMKSPTYW